MAFDKAGLQRIGGGVKGDAPQVWTYKTTDDRATVDTNGYFDNGATTNTGMRNHMAVGDMIVLFTNSGGTLQFGIAFVNAVSSGVIDIADVLTAGTLDSD